MKEIPLAKQIRQEISSLQSKGMKADTDLFTELIRKS